MKGGDGMLGDSHAKLNSFLVRVFHDILRIEEQSLSKGEFGDLSMREMHIIESICEAGEQGADNRTTAMTGHQDNPGIEATLSLGTVAPVDIAGLCRACGVEKVLTADAFDLAAVRKALEECTAYDGVSVLITRGDCVFVSRSPKPARVVDADKCIACGKCIQSGCPSVVLSDEKHPRTGKRKARIEPVTCVGCGICAQICPVHAISGPEQA